MLGLLLGGLWLLGLGLWLSLHPALNADALYLHDLLRSSRGLATWDLPPAPSLLPDLGLLRLARAFSDNLMEAQRLYGLGMGLLLWLLLARLLRALFDLPAVLARAHSAAGLLLALLLLPLGPGLGDWMQPSHHGMALLAALWLWSWGLKQKERPSGWIASAWVGLGLGVFAHSDKLLWVWGVLPLTLLALRLKAPGRLRVAGLLALAAVSALLADWLLDRTGARVATLRWSFIFSRSAADWGVVLAQLPALLKQHLGLAMAGTLALGLWASPVEQRHSGPRVLLLGLALACGVSLGLASLLGSFNPRYLYLLLWLPACLLPVLLAERRAAWEKPALLLPLLGALLWLRPAGDGAPLPLELQRARALDAALEPRGLRYGWADYWQARPLRLLSERGTVLVPMVSGAGRVDPYLWISDRELFMQGDGLNNPQFVITNGLDPAALQARVGTPPEIVTVQDLTVWVLVQGAKR